MSLSHVETRVYLDPYLPLATNIERLALLNAYTTQRFEELDAKLYGLNFLPGFNFFCGCLSTQGYIQPLIDRLSSYYLIFNGRQLSLLKNWRDECQLIQDIYAEIIVYFKIERIKREQFYCNVLKVNGYYHAFHIEKFIEQDLKTNAHLILLANKINSRCFYLYRSRKFGHGMAECEDSLF